MSVLVVGLSHHTAPVTLLERVALTSDEAVKLSRDVHQADHIAEAMVLSTCNRVEVYAAVSRFHAGVEAVSELFARHCAVSLDELASYLYVHYEDRAVQHLFCVACGLDSMVVGETQILGQVRAAFRQAQQAGTAGRSLEGVVQRGLRAGKRAHTETGIDRTGSSLVSVGLGIVGRELSGLGGRCVLVLGAGSMSALAVTTAARAGADIVVANRTPGRGRQLARSVGGRAVALTELDTEMRRADVVVSCTGAAEAVISAELASAVMQARRGAGAEGETRERGGAGAPPPLFLLDLALPRDVDREAGELLGVTLVDLEALQARTGADVPSAADAGAGADTGTGSGNDLERVRGIVTEEVTAYLGEQRAAEVAPTVTALRSKASEVVEAELARLPDRLPQLDEHAQEEVAHAVRRVVGKLLHAPTVRVKELASSPGGDTYATALRELFDLDPQAPEAVSRADVSRQERRT